MVGMVCNWGEPMENNANHNNYLRVVECGVVVLYGSLKLSHTSSNEMTGDGR